MHDNRTSDFLRGKKSGTLIYIGEKEAKQAEFSLMEYNEADLRESSLNTFDRCLVMSPDRVAWVNVNGLTNVQNLEKIGECFQLHHLILEDILNTDQRPKREDLGDYLYLVLKMLHYNDQGELASDQVSLVFGKYYLISLHENEQDLFHAIRERLRARGRLRRLGADYLAYSLVDLIVDHYFLILERLGETIEDLEEELVSKPTQDTLRRIHQLKREMIILRRSVWPLREVLSQLQRRESPLIEEATAIYFKDVYDHVIQVIDSIETYRDMLSGMLDVYLSSVSNRLNEVMKVLTIIATIFIPLTFIAGVVPVPKISAGSRIDTWMTPRSALWNLVGNQRAGETTVHMRIVDTLNALSSAPTPRTLRSNVAPHEITCRLCDAIRNTAEASGAEALFRLIPNVEARGQAIVSSAEYARLRACLRGRNLRFLDLEPVFRRDREQNRQRSITLGRDRHWSAHGNAVVSRALHNHFRRRPPKRAQGDSPPAR